jgi:thimet oligopeptidase
MKSKLKIGATVFVFSFLITLNVHALPIVASKANLFNTALNVPVDYAKVTPMDLVAYSQQTVDEVKMLMNSIKQQKALTFDAIFGKMDEINNHISKASNNCFMLYWVSTDSLIRSNGLAGYQLLDSLSTAIYSDKDIFTKMQDFKASSAYSTLVPYKKILVDDLILNFKMSGVNLAESKLKRYKELTKEINEISTDYSNNMNSFSDVLTLDEKGMMGLPEAFKTNYKVGEGKYEIPVLNSTNETVMSNATDEETRKAFYFKFSNRAADRNLSLLDSLVKKRDELAKIIGYPTYASYNLVTKMASEPKTVWNFLADLVEKSKEKAKSDITQLENEKRNESKNESKLKAWDIAYYKNQIVKSKYQVNHEQLREFFPMEQCLKGMLEIYQKLLGFEFKKVSNPSVWHEEVEMYEVYENGKIKGRFYMDLFPRPNKETWFYGVNIIPGKAMKQGYEFPVAMLLGNFSKPSKTQPSLLSQKELNTLFHEFGHIMNMMSYHGEFSSQSSSKADFVEAMSQLFENWISDFDVVSTFAKHYKTGELLPKETFENMLKAKNVASGLVAIQSLQRCLYDMNLYDKFNPENPVSTDQLWKNIDKELAIMEIYVDNTHPQASWIHVNTHPVYMYGYIWSRVYAQDMFTVFEKNGLTDTKTGVKYRELILANGTQKDVVKAVEEFLGRSSNNAAYIKSLGLDK